jgi:hypothetical protein
MSLRIYKATYLFLLVSASLRWLDNVSCSFLSYWLPVRFCSTVVGFFKGRIEIHNSLWDAASADEITWQQPACALQPWVGFTLDFQKVYKQLWLTNKATLWTNKALAASSFTFIVVKIFPAFSGDWQKYAANIIKLTQTGINRNKYTFCIMKLLEPPKILKTSRVHYLGLVM